MLLALSLKFMLKKIFTKLGRWFVKDFNLKKTLTSCGVSLLAFSLIFIAGSFSSKTVNEACADYYAKISREYTVERSNKKLSGLLVEPKDGKTSKVRQDTDNAITELWGVFKGENASFAPVMNANRKDAVYFEDAEFSTESLPIVYSNVGGSSEPYHRDKATKDIIDYKYQSSPIALMFSSSQTGMQEKLHIYISQTQAERKLKAMGVDNINYDALKALQNTETNILINGKTISCVIDNIYLDNFSHSYRLAHYDYYYATDIGTIIGDFVFVIFYAYKYSQDITIKKQSLYVMSEYSYRNKFYLEYAKENYSPEDFSFDYARSNFKNDFIPDDSILQNTLLTAKFDIWCILITVVFVISFLASLFLIYRYTLFKQPLSLLTIFSASLIPYLIFKIIFILTNNTYIFSSYSLIANLILFVAFALTILILNCFGRKVIAEETK